MGSAIVSGCGKLNTNEGESNLLYLNIITIPVEPNYADTRFMFLSKQEVNNINDFLDVLNFYNSYGQHIILVGGDYVIKSTSSTQTYNRYAVVDLFKYIRYPQEIYVNLTYRKTSTTADDTVRLFEITGEHPTNWIFANIKL